MSQISQEELAELRELELRLAYFANSSLNVLYVYALLTFAVFGATTVLTVGM
jgi:hypothetical protein